MGPGCPSTRPALPSASWEQGPNIYSAEGRDPDIQGCSNSTLSIVVNKLQNKAIVRQHRERTNRTCSLLHAEPNMRTCQTIISITSQSLKEMNWSYTTRPQNPVSTVPRCAHICITMAPMVLKENGQAANSQLWWPLGSRSAGHKLGTERAVFLWSGWYLS